MTTEQLLTRLREMNVRVWAEGDRLRLSAARGVLTPDLQQELSAHKAEILSYLQIVQAAAHADALSIQPGQRDGDVPLSFSQERMWVLEQMNRGSTALHLSISLWIKGASDLDGLARSLNEIVRRHEILRTAFKVVNGRPMQVIDPDLTCALQVVNIEHLAPADLRAEVNRLVTDLALRPFDLTQAPLMRAMLIQLGDLGSLLYIVLHHIVCDGWSKTILINELGVLYNAFSAGQPSPLPMPPIQYADFARWQRERMQAGELSSQVDYWRDRLKDSPRLLNLPTDYPRPSTSTFRSGNASTRLTPGLVGSLRGISQQEGATLFMTLLAAFNILLSRYSGQEDICVGTPVAGRIRTELETLIGVFINNLVLRTNLSGNPTFRELLRRVRAISLEAQSNQEVPFEKVVEVVQPERSMSQTPLFQVMFNMLNFGTSMSGVELAGLEVQSLGAAETDANFDMTLYTEEREGHIGLQLVYNAELFTHERMVELLNQYNHLLEQIAGCPDEDIARYSLVTPEAKQRLPDPTQSLDAEPVESVLARFAAQARQLPEQTAVIDPYGAWNYSQLDTLSNRLANYLCALGIHSEDRVAIYAHRSATLIVALLGVMKAGAAFVILDPSYPASQLMKRLSLVKPKGLIRLGAAGPLPAALEQFLASTFAITDSQIELPYTITEINEVLKNWSPEAPMVSAAPNDLLYVAFTSGSTGEPKGILGEYGPLAHFLGWHSRTFNLTSSDRFSMLSGLAHDPLLRDVFAPLWAGATLCIPPAPDMETVGRMAAWMHEQNITVTHLTPAMSELLTETGMATVGLPLLHYAFFGGDRLTEWHVSRLRRLAPAVTCVDFYGTTETPQAMAYHVVSANGSMPPMQDNDAFAEKVVPVGRGIDGVQLLVLTHDRQLAGIGELGGIYVRTPYLTRGYLEDKALTQERFICNPLTHAPADRVYCTGDIGYYLPNGDVVYRGRGDKQVEIRGFRVELEGVETVIRQHPAVRQVTVLVREDGTSDKRLVAYVVNDRDTLLDSIELRSYLKERLPGYMIPSVFMFVESLPLTPNGKVDHNALPRTLPADFGINARYMPPRTNTEVQLVRIWQNILGVPRVGVADNFFELGGSSLLAVRLFALIEEVFGIRLPVSTIFHEASVEHMAKALDQHTRLVPWPSLVPLQPHGSKTPIFFVHPFAGDVIAFKTWADYLGDDQPFYGLRAVGLDGIQDPLDRIEDIAARYLSEIKLVQPAGPYYLGGYCAGSPVAFEMAQQLYAEGQQVALVAIVNFPPPQSNYRQVRLRPQLFSSFIRNLPFWVRDFTELNREEKAARVRQGLIRTIAMIAKTNGHTLSVKGNRMHDTRKQSGSAGQARPANDRLKYALAFRRALDQYVPRVYPGRIVVFKTQRQPLICSFDSQLCWGPLAAGGLDVQIIPGSNTTMFRGPYARILTERLRYYLDGIQAPNLPGK